MSTINSALSYKFKGDINTSRGQLGQSVFLSPNVPLIEQDVLNTPTAINPFNDIYNKYIFNSFVDFTFLLTNIGLNDNELQPGYSTIIHNQSQTNNILVTTTGGDLATLTPNYTYVFLAVSAPSTWQIIEAIHVGNIRPNILTGSITTTNATPMLIMTIPISLNKALLIDSTVICFDSTGGETSGFNYGATVNNLLNVCSLVGESINNVGTTNKNISMFSVINLTSVEIYIVGLTLTTIDWTIVTSVLST